jgi:hypothetical protein
MLFVENDGKYVKLHHDTDGSINNLSYFLGYHPNQLHMFFAETHVSNLYTIHVEIFTTNIAFIIFDDPYKTEISANEINRQMKNFNFIEEYSSPTVENILETGIENKSLKIDFLSRVLNINNAQYNGVYFIEKFGINLFFTDGFLTDFQSADGLSTWSRHWKNESFDAFKSYENAAKRY